MVHPAPASLWYKAMRDVGLGFGPSFQRQLMVEATANSRRSRTLVDLTAPESRFPQSPYPLHPTAIDACFQASTVSLSSGHRSGVSALMAPALIDDLVIFARDTSATAARGVAVSTAEWGGVGRVDDDRQLMAHVKAYDQSSGEVLLRLRGLRFHAQDSVSMSAHTFTKVVWNEDFHFLSPEGLSVALLRESGQNDEETALARLAKVAELVAHKMPSATVLEVVLEDGPDRGRSMWIDSVRGRAGPLAKDCSFRLSSPSQRAGLDARQRYAAEPNIEYAVHDPREPFGCRAEADEVQFDLVILRVRSGTPPAGTRR